MKLKPPATVRSFANVWGELEYVCKKVRFWLYARKQPLRAKRYLGRLEHILARLPDNNMAIIRHDGFAMLHEIRGEIGNAIAHRKREIALMERLQLEASNCNPKTRAYMLRDRDAAALQNRRAILESLQKQKRLPGAHVNDR